MKRKEILKYLRGETTEAERLRMLRWLEADPSHMEEYRRLRMIFDVLLCSDDGTRLSAGSLPRSGGRKWMRVAAVAAAVAIGFVVGGLYIHGLSDNDGKRLFAASSVHVPVGQRTEMVLNDGTRVWLNSNTTLYIDEMDSGCRQVTLDGEAYFEVAPDERLPFVVKAGVHEVQVLGTKFDVYAYEDWKDFSVRLYEGSVDVGDVRNDLRLRLSPDEEAVVSGDGQLVKGPFDKENSLSWIDGILYFDNADFKHIFGRLEEYYKVSVKVRDPEILRYRCTCKFRQEDGLKHILETLRRLHKFEYKWSEDNRSVTVF